MDGFTRIGGDNADASRQDMHLAARVIIALLSNMLCENTEAHASVMVQRKCDSVIVVV